MKSKKPEYLINKKKLARYVAKAKKGNQKAMEQVACEVSRYIYFYSITMLGDEDKAEEAVQDILLSMIKNIKTIEKDEAFLGWIKTATANYCKSKISRSHKEQSIEDMDIQDDCNQVNPEKCIETDEICQILGETVRLLPPLQRESVMMYYYQQMSVSEIAEILDTNENTVKSRLYSARKNLRKILEKNGHGNLTLSGISPLAFISYTLISEAEKEQNFAIPVAMPKGEVFIASAKTASAATGAIAIKIGAIGCAAVAAAGGVGAYVVSQSPSENTFATENKQEETVEVTIVPTQRKLSFTADDLFYSNGFTDDDLRTEVVFKPDQDLNSKNNKKYILDRMCNSMDFFHTVQATYFFDEPAKNPVNSYYCTYLLDEDNLRCKEIEAYPNGEFCSYGTLLNGVCYETYAYLGSDDDVDYTSVNEPKKTVADKVSKMRSKAMLSELFDDYYIRPMLCETERELDFVKNVDVFHRKRYDKETNEEMGCFRDDHFHTSRVYEHYLPQIFVETHNMTDLDNWTVESIGNLLGNECFSIKGRSNGFNNIYSYEMQIDKQTGAMLGLNAYDQNGGLVRRIITYEFVVDGIIDESVYDDKDEADTKIRERGY